MSYIPEYHENYYRVEGTAFNQGKIGIGTVNPVDLLHVSGGNFRLNGTGYFGGDLNITGNLNVYGTAAQFAVQQIFAEDKAIELNVQTGSPIGGSGLYTTTAISDDAGADEGGLILRSTQGDKVILYETVSPASGWTSNLRWTVSGNYGKNTLNLSDTTVNVGMTIGGDTNLYRSAADTLRTDDSLIVDGANFTVNSTTITLGDANTDTVTINAGPVNLPNATAAPDALEFGAGPNLANLYRSANDTLRTDDSFIVGGNLQILGNTQFGDTNSDNVTISGRLSKSVALISGNSTGSGAAVLSFADNNIITGASGADASVLLPLWASGREVQYRNRSPFTIRIHPTGEPIFQALNLINPGVGASPFVSLTSNSNRSFIAARSGVTNIWFSDI